MISEEMLESEKKIRGLSDEVLQLYDQKPLGLVISTHISVYISILEQMGMNADAATKYGILLVEEFQNINRQIDDR